MEDGSGIETGRSYEVSKLRCSKVVALADEVKASQGQAREKRKLGISDIDLRVLLALRLEVCICWRQYLFEIAFDLFDAIELDDCFAVSGYRNHT